MNIPRNLPRSLIQQEEPNFEETISISMTVLGVDNEKDVCLQKTRTNYNDKEEFQSWRARVKLCNQLVFYTPVSKFTQVIWSDASENIAENN